MFNFNHLYYFYVTARYGSVTAAAHALHLSQPSLSAQLKVLEGSLGRKLFEKSGRTLQLTGTGRFLAERCNHMFANMDVLWRSLSGSGNNLKNQVHLGISTEISRTFIATLISGVIEELKCRTLLPYLSISSWSVEQNIARLKEQLIDAAIVDQPVSDPGIHELATLGMPVVFICGQVSSELRDELQQLGLKALLQRLGKRWVLPVQSMRMRQEIDSFFVTQKIIPQIVCEADTMVTIIQAVESGLGISILPSAYVEEQIQSGALVGFGPKNGLWVHQLYLLTAKNNGKVNELIEPLRAQFKNKSTLD